MDYKTMSTPSSPILRAEGASRPNVPTRHMSMGPHRWQNSSGNWDINSIEGEMGEMRIKGDVVRSDSSNSNGSTRPTLGPDVPVYSAGNGGLTNTPDRPGPWGTLKRTLTSLSLKNTVPEEVISSSPGRRIRTQSAQILPRPMTHSRSSSFRDDSPSGSGILGEDENNGGEGEGGLVMLAPRRRRSVRLLQGLRSLTAM